MTSLLRNATNPEAVVTLALRRAFEAVTALGAGGVSRERRNRFGETALLADIVAEEAVLDVLKSSGLSVAVRSEEHGDVDFGTDQLAVLDGLDGSGVYAEDPLNGRCGTMLCLYANADPLYSEFLCAGIMEHATRRLLLATRDQPLQLIDVHTGNITYPRTRRATKFTSETVTFADEHSLSDRAHPLFHYSAQNAQLGAALLGAGVAIRASGSTAANIVDIAVSAADLDVTATRKGNLEFATAVPILTAAGGVVRTLDGEDLSHQRFLEFGQGRNAHIPVLLAANDGIASEAARIISSGIAADHSLDR